MMSERQKEACRKDLNSLRELYKSKPVRSRLGVLPSYSSELFGMYRLEFMTQLLTATGGYRYYAPCDAFGKQLVLKIVDELLDD